jgi:transcriptional regulator with GAF, ATPase, and Fis domain
VAAYLEVVGGRGAGRRWPLGDGEAAIGRDASCEISFFDESISRRHASVRGADGRYRVRDLGSRNGTFLNGEPLVGESPLRSGDEVQVGDTLLRFVDEVARARDTRPAGRRPGAAGFQVEGSMPLEGGSEPVAATEAERRLRALLSLGRLIATTDHAGALLARAVGALPDTLAADRVVAVLTDERGGLDLQHAASAPAGAVPSETLLRHALGGEEALLISPDDAVLARESVVAQGVRAVMTAPMRSGGITRGVLYADRLRSCRRFDVDDLSFLAEVARQLGAALAALARTVDAKEESEAWRRLATRPHDSVGPPRLVGESPPFLAALETARRAAASDAPVLLLGETGTGKELVARLVHRESPRRASAFVAINCAALPEALLESELFGHERGAFTGADRRRRGLFELAHRGTLFLDEVGEMPPPLQAKLLRVLETGELRRVGSEAVIRVSARVVAATNRDLAEAVDAGGFREDLYFRLAVLTLPLPPLRRRPGDARLLARAFVSELAHRLRRPQLTVTDDALDAIARHAWPGNVRELRNAIERAAALADGDEIDAALLDLGPSGARAHAAPTGDQAPITIAEAERRAVVAALRHTCGRKGEAAELLGIAHPTLNRKIKAYGIELP